jgi:hypothetical protein
MPYIDKNRRHLFEDGIQSALANIETAGELNYVITRLLHGCVENWGEKYAVYNELIGALECAKLELYRRRISKYEDKKIEKNGDV